MTTVTSVRRTVFALLAASMGVHCGSDLRDGPSPDGPRTRDAQLSPDVGAADDSAPAAPDGPTPDAPTHDDVARADDARELDVVDARLPADSGSTDVVSHA